MSKEAFQKRSFEPDAACPGSHRMVVTTVRAAHTAQDLEFPRELKAADWPAQGPLVLTVWMDALRLQVLPLDLNPKL